MQPFHYSTGIEAARYLQHRSQKGDNPIGILAVIGHHNAGSNGVYGVGKSDIFRISDVFAAAMPLYDNSYNDLEHSSKREGPPKCWFTRDSVVYGVSCWSANGWANQWAAQIARGDGSPGNSSRVLGTTQGVATWRKRPNSSRIQIYFTNGVYEQGPRSEKGKYQNVDGRQYRTDMRRFLQFMWNHKFVEHFHGAQ